MLTSASPACSSCTATEDHLIVATSDPPAIQIIPWPSDADGTGPDKTHTTLIRKMPWLEVHPPAGEPRAKPSTNIAPRGHAVPYVNGTASIDPEPGFVIAMEHSPSMGLHIWLTSDGRAHSAYLTYEAKTAAWVGHTFHGASKSPTSESKSSPTPAPHLVSSKGKDRAGHAGVTDPGPLPPGRQATTSAINAPFALVAIGTRSGTVEVYSYQLGGSTSFSHSVSLPESSGSALGQVTSLAWTSDGHALAVGYARGWIVCSTYGRILSSSYRDSWVGIHRRFKDDHLFGVARLFWALGNNEVVLLARTDASAPDTEAKPFDPDAQLFALPFVRSVQSTFSGGASAASSGFGLLHAGEKLILYRGQELSEWQVIAPDAATEPSAMRPGRSSATAFGEGAAQGQAWQHIRLPSRYLAFNWPIRIAAPSQDGGWLAIAGRRGFAVSCLTPTAHAQAYGSSGPTSGSLRPGQDALGVGKWRLFDGDHMRQEQAFAVRGGLGWFGHFVVVAADAAGEAQLRVYDATSSLDNSHLLAVQRVPAPIVLMRIYPDASNANAGSFTGQSTGASILLYTTANSLYHLRLTFLGRVMRHPQLFMGNPSAQQETYSAPSVILKTVSNISLDSVVSEPTRVRGLDWLVAPDLPLLKPREALNKATLIFLINGKLVLLRPRILTSVPLPSLRSSADASKSPDVTTSAVASYGPAVSASAPVASKIDFSEKIGNDLTFAQDANGHSIPEPDAVPSDGAAVPPTESPAPQASTPRLTSALSTSQVVTVTSSINTAPRLTSESAITLPKPQAQITYDTHILTEQVEFVWTTSTLTGAPKALNNTLWAYVEGRGLRVWKETGQQGQLSAHAATSGLTPSPSSLTNSDTASQPSNEASDLVRPLLPHVGTFLPLDFYPLCLLAVRGVVVGMESSLTLRKSLDFGLWRTRTATHLFLPGLLRHFLNAGEHSDASEAVDTAVRFARPYATLGYFPHALEILLHAVLEDTADGGPSPATSAATSTSPASSIPSTPFLAKFGTELQSLNCSRLDSSSKKHQSRAAYQAAQGAEELRRTVELVNSFPNNLDVIANCARKTEAARWPILFDAVGAPGDLLSAALRNGETRTAAAFLLVVFSFKSDEAEPAAVALIRATVARGEYARALDVLRFLATVKPDDPQLAARIVRQSDFLVKKPSISEQAASSQPDATMLYDTESSAGRISEPSS